VFGLSLWIGFGVEERILARKDELRKTKDPHVCTPLLNPELLLFFITLKPRVE